MLNKEFLIDFQLIYHNYNKILKLAKSKTNIKSNYSSLLFFSSTKVK